MADRVLYQTDDDLSEQNLTEQRALSNLTDYVERGLTFNADFQANTLDIGSGHAIVRDGTQAYDVFPDARSGLGLASTTGLNYVYLAIQPGTDDDVRYEIKSSQTPPSDPSLLIGTVDAGSDTSTVMNRAPDGEFQEVSAEDISGAKIVGAGGYDTIMAAHDALPSDGGIIELREAIAETEIEVTKPVVLEAGGQSSNSGSTPDSRIEVDTSGGDGIWLRERCTLRDVSIVGGGGNYNLRVGESGSGSPGMTIINTSVKGSGGDNVQIRGLMQQGYYHFPDIRGATGDGVVIQTDIGGSDYFNANEMYLMHAAQNGGDGLAFDGGANGNAFFVVSEANSGTGVALNSPSTFEGNQFSGYGVEANSTVGVDFSSAPADSRGNSLDWFFAQSAGDNYNPKIWDTLNIAKLRNTHEASVVRVEKTADQSLTAATPARLTFDNVDTDNRGEWDNSNDEFVPAEISEYRVSLTVAIEAAADQERFDIRFYNNGNLHSETLCRLNGAGFQSFTFTDIVTIGGGNPFYVEVEQTNSGDTVIGDSARTNMSIEDVR